MEEKLSGEDNNFNFKDVELKVTRISGQNSLQKES